MPDAAPGRRVTILSHSWLRDASELSFVTRALAGAASRRADVTVAVPGPAGRATPDGAFDLVGVGGEEGGAWPTGNESTWTVPPDSTVILDEDVDVVAGVQPQLCVARREGNDGLPALRFAPTTDGPAFIGLQVPVNPLAASHRHNGLGFTGYLLVLTDRPAGVPMEPPSADVAWLTAAFPEANVVVVENAAASVWRGRVLRGSVGVDTRTDFWRLLAHAQVTIDLEPGPIVARECIESLRFATPIIVTADPAWPRPTPTMGGGRRTATSPSCSTAWPGP